jgi:UPF0755 protein
MKKRLRLFGCLGVLVLLGLGAWTFWSRLNAGIQATAPGEMRYVRFDENLALVTALTDLQERGIVRNAQAFDLWARIMRKPRLVQRGTYELRPGMDADEILAALRKPVRQMVRLPETNWARRSANLLEKNGVTTAEEYMKLVHSPKEFEGVVSFPLPETTLEGYLYPDTYDLPPLLGAREVIVRQLQAFERKVWKELNEPENLERLIIVASMIELEVARDDERPVVAGVIENRLRINMRLQIDATVLYALQEWRALTFRDLRETDSPYNTYRNSGLPPGPICSPSIKSVRGALEPAEHNYLYYVALPEGRHLFSATYAEHLANIQKRREALARQGEN